MSRPTSLSAYALTYSALVVLATASLLCSFVLSGSDATGASLAFAVAKATLVVWIFMHLRERHLASRMALCVCVGFVILLVSLAVTDVVTRHTAQVRPAPTEGEPFYAR